MAPCLGMYMGSRSRRSPPNGLTCGGTMRCTGCTPCPEPGSGANGPNGCGGAGLPATPSCRPSMPRRRSCPVDTPAAGGGATERESTSENSRSTDPTVSAENPPSSARGYFVVSTCAQRASCGEREAGKRYVQRRDRRLQRTTVVDDAHVDDEVRAKRDSLDEELFGFVAVWR